MTTILYLLTLVLPLVTVLIVFAMRYYAAIQEAKARLANDGAYRQLVESASATHAQIATTLAAMETSLTEMRSRMAAVETVLKTVE